MPAHEYGSYEHQRPSSQQAASDGVGPEARAGPSALIISGGSAGNQILDAFTSIYEKCTFVLPVSDNGGSSSEIIRWD